MGNDTCLDLERAAGERDPGEYWVRLCKVVDGATLGHLGQAKRLPQRPTVSTSLWHSESVAMTLRQLGGPRRQKHPEAVPSPE